MSKETNIPPIELILDYLDGVIDSENAKILQQQIEGSEELKAIVNGIIQMRDSADYTDEAFKEYIERLRDDFDSKNLISQNRKPGGGKWLKVAASIILLIGTLFLIQLLFFRESADDFVDGQLSQIYEAPQLFRNEETDWPVVHQLYKSRKFDSAIEELLKMRNSDPKDITASFYLGLCYLYNKKPNESIEYLQEVSQSSSRLSDRARWYAALAYFQIRNESTARSILEDIVKNKGYRYQEAGVLRDMLD